MAKHAHATQKWAYSAEQMAEAMANPETRNYKRGMLDALRAVARLEAGDITATQLQEVLNGLPNTWNQDVESAYVTGFEDMYGLLAESMSTEYAPETEKAAELAAKTPPEAKKDSGGSTFIGKARFFMGGREILLGDERKTL